MDCGRISLVKRSSSDRSLSSFPFSPFSSAHSNSPCIRLAFSSAGSSKRPQGTPYQQWVLKHPSFLVQIRQVQSYNVNGTLYGTVN